MRFVRSTPPPLPTALSCQETPLERQAVVNEQVVDQSPRQLHCCVFNNSDFSFSAKLHAFSVQYTVTLASCRKITFEAFTAEASQLDLGGWVGVGFLH